jgi:hypothetical protein
MNILLLKIKFKNIRRMAYLRDVKITQLKRADMKKRGLTHVYRREEATCNKSFGQFAVGPPSR